MATRIKKTTRKERLKEVASDFQATAEEQSSASRFQLKADEDLFVVDTVATIVRKKRKLEPKERKAKVEATKLFKKALKSQAFERKRPRPAKPEQVEDLWEVVQDEGGAKAAKTAPKARATPKHAKPSTSACHPGLSYNPQTKDHQDVVAAAVAVELSRNEAQVEKDELWARALAVKVVASDDVPLSDEEPSDEDDESVVVAKRENRGKLTRAELNRRARHRQSLMLQRQTKRNKSMLHQIGSAKQFIKVIASEERDSASKPKKEVSTEVSLEAMMGRKAQSAAALINAKAIPAPLSDELTGSLRCLKTKSSVVMEQLSAKQFAVDPQLKVKKTLRTEKKKSKSVAKKHKLKVRERYFTE